MKKNITLISLMFGVMLLVSLGAVSADFERVQESEAEGNPDATATWSSAPEEGNLLVAISFHRYDSETPEISGGDWILRETNFFKTPEETDDRRGMAVWTKIAESGEPNVVTTWSGPSLAQPNKLIIQEFEKDSSGDWIFVDSDSNNNGASGTSSLSTGSISSPYEENLVITALGKRGSTGGEPSWDNAEYNNGSSGDRSLWSAFFEDDSGTIEDEASYDTSDEGGLATAAILAFSFEPVCELDITNPLAGDFLSGNEDIDWTIGGDEASCSSKWNVYYHEGSCNPSTSNEWVSINSNDVDDLTYPWDTSSVSDGEYCLKVVGTEKGEEDREGLMLVDNSAPVANASGPYECNEGETITLNGSLSYDEGNPPSGIDTYEWQYANGTSIDSGKTIPYYCADGDANIDVKLVVTDKAGNTDDDTSDVTINNLPPTCSIDEAPTDAPTGYETGNFLGSGTDPAGEDPYDTLSYSWDFDDGNSATGDSVTHTYDTAGNYNVTLTVSDEDGGVSEACSTEIQVIDPTPLTDQEVAAFYPLVAEFNDGSANNKFKHDLSGPSEDCEKIIGPDNLVVSDFGSDTYCSIFWDRGETGEDPSTVTSGDSTANPTNAERGNHFVLTRVYNNTDVNYYSFNVMVYSWIIPMEEEWNLISVPLTPEDSSKPGDVFDHDTVGEQIDQIWSYEFDADSGESEWKCVRPTSSIGSQCSSEITKLEFIESGRAYWVKLKDDAESATVKGFGISPNEVKGGQTPPQVNVPTNSWSLIGRYGIVGKDYHADPDWERVHGWLTKDWALDSIGKLDNDLHVYDDEFTIVEKLFNNEGYWLWIEDNAFNNAGFETYGPIDSWYPKNSGLSILV